MPIAAACAATTVLARAGLLRGRRHTSNSLMYLEMMVPGYAGQSDYGDAPAVTDGRITTASGLGAVDFTMSLLESLDVATPELRHMWYRAFKHGEYPEGIEHGG